TTPVSVAAGWSGGNFTTAEDGWTRMGKSEAEAGEPPGLEVAWPRGVRRDLNEISCKRTQRSHRSGGNFVILAFFCGLLCCGRYRQYGWEIPPAGADKPRPCD